MKDAAEDALSGSAGELVAHQSVSLILVFRSCLGRHGWGKQTQEQLIGSIIKGNFIFVFFYLLSFCGGGGDCLRGCFWTVLKERFLKSLYKKSVSKSYLTLLK